MHGCDSTLKYVSRFPLMLYGADDWAVNLQIEFGELRCGEETCIDVKYSTALLISNLVFQIARLPSCLSF